MKISQVDISRHRPTTTKRLFSTETISTIHFIIVLLLYKYQKTFIYNNEQTKKIFQK